MQWRSVGFAVVFGISVYILAIRFIFKNQNPTIILKIRKYTRY